jgi:D-glycero-beta-D-manno-heptose 1-phosphate adenylyltransferase
MKFEWKSRIIKLNQLTEAHEKLKKKKKKIVYTAGAWDMLHVGQIRYLQEAKKQGDVLVVGVSSNDVIRKLKGSNRPILDEKIRAEMLTYIRFVDLVTIVKDTSNQPTIALLQPDVYITVKENWNSDYKQSKEYKTVIKYGGKVKLVNRQSPYISTTQILKRSVGAQLNDVFKDLVKIGKKPLKEKKI